VTIERKVSSNKRPDAFECEICGVDAPSSSFYWGWGGPVCTDNPECRAPFGPRRREVATLTTAVLDDLEYVADEAEATCQTPEIDHLTLRALIDAARACERMPARNIGVGLAMVASHWLGRAVQYRHERGNDPREVAESEMRQAGLWREQEGKVT
jgi:hypothetical protein